MEPEKQAAATSTGADSFLVMCVVLGLALLAVVLLGALFPGAAELLPWFSEPAMPVAAEQAREAIEMNGARTTLVAFDYTPSMAGELDGVALALLTDLAANGARVAIVDIDADSAQKAAAERSAAGQPCIAVPADVADFAGMAEGLFYRRVSSKETKCLSTGNTVCRFEILGT